MANQITVDIVADVRNLVNGVKTTNNSLASLNKSANTIIGSFKGVAAALGATVSISWFKDALKGAEEEEKTFAALAELYGADAEAIKAKVGNISKMFYVDDGTIAQLVLDLRGALRAELDPLAADLAEGAVVLSKVTNKPLDVVSAMLVKSLKDGKITMAEIQKLGINLNEEQQKAFDQAYKAGKSVEFLMGILTSPEMVAKAQKLTTPYEKLTFTLNELKDTVGGALLKAFEGLFNFFTDEDKNGIVKTNKNFETLKEEVLLLLGAFAAYKAALGIASLINILTDATKGATVAQRIYNITLAANPIGAIILGITALIAIIILVVRHWDTVKEAAGKALGFIKTAWEGIKDWFGNLGNTIKNAIGNLFNTGKSFGSDIINGLVQGIKNMAMAPINAIKSVVSGVTSAIKSVLKIGSPSKVFAGFGKNIVEGLSNGIDGAQRLAAESMSSLSGGLTLTPSYGTSRGTVNVTINAGLGTDPYEMGRAVRAALNKYDGVNG